MLLWNEKQRYKGVFTMKLYELTNDFTMLFDQFDAINSWEPDTDADGNPIDDDGNIIEDAARYKEDMLTAWFDTLESIEGEFEQKAESVAVYFKNLQSDIKQLKAEEQALKGRRLQKEKSAEQLKTYLLNSLQVIGRKKIDMPRVVISLKNNPPKLMVDDELSFINWAMQNNDDLLKYSEPEIRKQEVMKLLKAGNSEIPYVHTEQGVSLTIK